MPAFDELGFHVDERTQRDLSNVLAKRISSFSTLSIEEIGRTASRAQLLGALAEVSGYTPLPDIYKLVDRDLLGRFDPNILSRGRIVPLVFKDDVLVVAISDPMTRVGLDYCHKAFPGARINVFLTHHREISRVTEGALAGQPDSTSPPPSTPATEEYIEPKKFDDLDLAVQTPGDHVNNVIKDIFLRGINNGASDIHFKAQGNAFYYQYRIHGDCTKRYPLELSLRPRIDSILLNRATGNIDTKHCPSNGRFVVTLSDRKIDIRYARVPTSGGFLVVVRITDKSKIELTLGQGELMLHPKVLTALKRVLALPCGLILISGATGSGKSSTIIAALRSQNFDKFNIITLEDPVEETINGVSHIQVDNTIERNNFRSCMSTAVRLDPDIINIGEVRDDESASAVINAAMTGHLVLSTIHSASSSLIISRLEHFGVKRYDIAQTLVAACSQRLIRVLCQHCCVPHVCTQDDVDIYGIPKEWFDEQVVLNKRTVDGCPECNGLGYSGRTPLLEILPISKDTASDLGDGTLLPLDLDTRVKKEFDVPLMRDLALDALKSGISDIEAVTSVIAL